MDDSLFIDDKIDDGPEGGIVSVLDDLSVNSPATL